MKLDINKARKPVLDFFIFIVFGALIASVLDLIVNARLIWQAPVGGAILGALGALAVGAGWRLVDFFTDIGEDK